jgi:hypothetical protein
MLSQVSDLSKVRNMNYVSEQEFNDAVDRRNNVVLIQQAERQFKEKCRSGRYALRFDQKVKIFEAFKRFKDNELKDSAGRFQ